MTAPDPSERAGEGLTKAEIAEMREAHGGEGYQHPDLSYEARRCYACDEPVPCQTIRLLDALADRMAARAGEVAEVLAAHVRLTAMDTPFTCSCEPDVRDGGVHHLHVAAALTASGLVGGRADEARAEGVEALRAVEREILRDIDRECQTYPGHGDALRIIGEHIDRIESGEEK